MGRRLEPHGDERMRHEAPFTGHQTLKAVNNIDARICACRSLDWVDNSVEL